MYYRKKLNSQNILIKVVIKLDSKFYKLAIETYYSKAKSKTRLYYRYISHFSK